MTAYQGLVLPTQQLRQAHGRQALTASPLSCQHNQRQMSQDLHRLSVAQSEAAAEVPSDCLHCHTGNMY